MKRVQRDAITCSRGWRREADLGRQVFRRLSKAQVPAILQELGVESRTQVVIVPAVEAGHADGPRRLLANSRMSGLEA